MRLWLLGIVSVLIVAAAGVSWWLNRERQREDAERAAVEYEAALDRASEQKLAAMREEGQRDIDEAKAGVQRLRDTILQAQLRMERLDQEREAIRRQREREDELRAAVRELEQLKAEEEAARFVWPEGVTPR